MSKIKRLLDSLESEPMESDIVDSLRLSGANVVPFPKLLKEVEYKYGRAASDALLNMVLKSQLPTNTEKSLLLNFFNGRTDRASQIYKSILESTNA